MILAFDSSAIFKVTSSALRLFVACLPGTRNHKDGKMLSYSRAEGEFKSTTKKQAKHKNNYRRERHLKREQKFI